jgi:anti-sigma factor RsiW
VSDEHVVEELPALVGGELDLDETRRVTNHLRACAECRQELVEVAAGIGLMRRLDEVSAVPVDVPEPLPVSLESVRRSRSRPAVLVAAAAAILLLVGVAVAGFTLTGSDDSGPSARVVLAPVSTDNARGSVAMRTAGSAQAMEVDTSLDAAPSDGYYEVWLLDRDSGQMLPVGVLPPDGRGTYRLSGELLERYDTVDISLQPDDGSTEHSKDSVLRANYS